MTRALGTTATARPGTQRRRRPLKQVPYSVTRNVTTVRSRWFLHRLPFVAAPTSMTRQRPWQRRPGPLLQGRGQLQDWPTPHHQDHGAGTARKTVCYTVNEMVEERQVKRVAYRFARWFRTRYQEVAYTECVQESTTSAISRLHGMRESPYTGALQGSYCEIVPCQISKQVKVCVPETVMVARPAWSRLT